MGGRILGVCPGVSRATSGSCAVRVWQESAASSPDLRRTPSSVASLRLVSFDMLARLLRARGTLLSLPRLSWRCEDLAALPMLSLWRACRLLWAEHDGLVCVASGVAEGVQEVCAWVSLSVSPPVLLTHDTQTGTVNDS